MIMIKFHVSRTKYQESRTHKKWSRKSICSFTFAPLSLANSRQSYRKNWKPADKGSPVGLVVTLGSSSPDRFSVDFRMLSIIFPLNNLLFNLLISVYFFTPSDSVVDVVVTVVCFVLASRPPSWESGKPITLEGKLLPHRARRVIDLFFQLPTMLAHNLKRLK